MKNLHETFDIQKIKKDAMRKTVKRLVAQDYKNWRDYV